VLLVDRARFPSEIPRGHFIHRHGPRSARCQPTPPSTPVPELREGFAVDDVTFGGD
jgi:hypothetical protein